MREVWKIIFTFITILVLMAGCAAQSPSKKPQPQGESSGQKEVRFDPRLAGAAKEAAGQVKGVEDSTAVVINNEISTAVKVTGFDRLRLKSILEEVDRKVCEVGKGYKVHVTSDKKLFKELQDIEKQVNSPRGQPDEIQKKVEKINEDMKG